MKKYLLAAVGALLAAVLAAAGLLLARQATAGRYERQLSYDAAPERQYIEFGKYPQTRIEDASLIARLNAQALSWQSYGYANGDGTIGSAAASDFMEYADVTLDGEAYRGVRFSAFRAYCCHEPSQVSWQVGAYDLNTVYWYRYDPIRWIVLDAEDGLLLSESVLDTQPINSVIYSRTPKKGFFSREFYKDPACTVMATDYYESDVRAWLNGAFFSAAFSAEEAAQIAVSPLDNGAWSSRDRRHASAPSEDRVFLLSFADTVNPAYGFSHRAEKPDDARIGYPTPYALIQGNWTHEGNGACYWWLRTAKGKTAIRGAALNLAVNYVGTICLAYPTPYAPDCIDTGIRPAIRLSGGVPLP